MSTTLVELAADLASFNNTSIDDALLAIRSGLSGETEPLKRYGIAISDARMRTELLAQGQEDLGATLTPLQKLQAAYTLILKDSTLAQGDFSRTSEGLANQLRIEEAELENVKASVGEDLIPLQLAWERGNLDIIRSIRGLNDVMHMGEVPREQLQEDVTALLRSTPALGGVLGDLAADMLDAADDTDTQRDAINDLTRANKGAKIPMEGVAEATESAADAFRKAQRPGGTLRTLLRDLGYEADETEQAIGDLAETIADELFGDAINAGNEARLKEEIKDLRKQRSEVKKNTPEWVQLTGEIAENEQSLFDLQWQMAQRAGPKAILDFLTKAQRKYGSNNAAIRRQITLLLEFWSLLNRFDDLGVITFGRYTGKTIPRAEGGPVSAGQTYLVGEEGPEFFVPDQSGTIYPNVGMPDHSYTATSGSGGWGTMGPISISVDARGLPNAGAVGSAVRQGVHDAMADVLRQQNARLPSGSRS